MNEFIEKLIGRLEEEKQACHINAEVYTERKIGKIIEIVNQLAEECNNDFCEWKIDGVYMRSPHDKVFVSCLDEEPYRYNYCPVCGKRIKAVEPEGE